MIDALLRPGGGRAVRAVMADLMLTTTPPSTEGLSFAEIKAITLQLAAEYIEQLKHLPPDLLKDAATRCSQRSKWFPKPAELIECAADELAELSDMRRRAKAMLDAMRDPKRAAAVAQPPEPLEVKLRNMVGIYIKHGRLKAAQECEDRLAALEGRVPSVIIEGGTYEQAPQSSPSQAP